MNYCTFDPNPECFAPKTGVRFGDKLLIFETAIPF